MVQASSSDNGRVSRSTSPALCQDSPRLNSLLLWQIVFERNQDYLVCRSLMYSRRKVEKAAS